MGRLCTICTSSARDDIESALLAHEESYRNIADWYDVGYGAVVRHERECMRLCFQESKELNAMLSAESLLAKLSQLNERTLRAVDLAERLHDLRMIFTGVAVSRANIETYAKIGPLSELEQRVAAVEKDGNIPQ